MTGDLLINGVDMATKGIDMGPGFIDALKTSLTFKEDIENESALQHGKRVVLSTKYEARDITLTFIVRGSSASVFATNDTYLNNLFLGRTLTVKVKGDGNYYRLIYTGKNVSYAHSPTGVVCKRVAKFTEIDPSDRGSTPLSTLFSV